jgi:hypothetical protein
MARIAIVELQTVASDENFASSVRDLSNDELTVMRGGTGGYEEKEKEKEDEEKKKCYPCPPPPCHPCHP